MSRGASGRLAASLLLTAATWALGGCASSGTYGAFKAYTTSFEKAAGAMRAGDLAAVEAVYAQDLPKDNGAALLANWEMGAFQQIGADPQRSRERLDRADAIARGIDSRAVVSMSQVAETAGSLLTNENVIEFRGEGYERVMSRTLNALNYLALGDLDGARVEVRKADEYQKKELARHEAELAEAKEKQKSEWKAAGQAEQKPEMKAALAEMDQVTAGVKSSFYNPFTSYLSGLVYELLGETDAAGIDYRRALELAPGSAAVQSAAYQAALAAEDKERLAAYKARFAPAVVRKARSPRPDEGEVVVLFQSGLIPRKQEVKFPVPLPGGSLAFVAFPIYTRPRPRTDFLEVETADAAPERTDTLVDLYVLAVKALKEQWPGITVRQIARAAAKEVAQHQLEVRAQKDGGDLAGSLAVLSGIVYKAVSERADLRAWYSLPADIQAARLFVPEGRRTLRLRWIDGSSRLAETVVPVEVTAGKKCIVNVRGFGGRLSVLPPTR